MNNLSTSASMPGSESPRQDPEPPIARDLIALLFDTSRLLCLQSDRLLGESVGLSEARARLLVAVSEAEPARMGELAITLGVSARSITSMVDALENQGLLARAPDPADRRATLLRLTEASRTRISQLHRAQHDLAQTLLTPLDVDAQTALFDMLTALKGRAASGPH